MAFQGQIPFVRSRFCSRQESPSPIAFRDCWQKVTPTWPEFRCLVFIRFLWVLNISSSFPVSHVIWLKHFEGIRAILNGWIGTVLPNKFELWMCLSIDYSQIQILTSMKHYAKSLASLMEVQSMTRAPDFFILTYKSDLLDFRIIFYIFLIYWLA